MSARRIALLAAAVTLAASGIYVAVYLGRWEWNRAVVAGLIFLAAEVGLVGALMLDRLARLGRRLGELEQASTSVSTRSLDSRPDPTVVARLEQVAPPARKPFAWLDEASQRTSVFVPVLLGAGVLLSGVAWLVERVGRMTAGPVLQRRLARRLNALALPPGGLLGEESRDPFVPGDRR